MKCNNQFTGKGRLSFKAAGTDTRLALLLFSFSHSVKGQVM